MDFLEQLQEGLLNKQGYYARVVSPMLASGNSIAIMTMPSNNRVHYYDGSYTMSYDFQVLAKHTQQLTAYYASLEISKLLLETKEIPSGDDSYYFEGINLTTETNVIGKDNNSYIYATQFSAGLFIKNKE